MAGKLDKGVFNISINDGVVGEHIAVFGDIESGYSIGEGATFGVEKGEVVGNVDGRRNVVLGFYVYGVQGFAC